MLGFVLATYLTVAAAEAPPQIAQVSTGWCSPNISNVTGKVTVHCTGVDPRALERLNAQLGSRKLQLAEKIREADEWVSRYKELESKLAEIGNDSALAKEAQEYLHQGDLEKAGQALDKLLDVDDKQAGHAARNQYNRGLVSLLQFHPTEALAHFQKAYELAIATGNTRESIIYGRQYAQMLFNQNDFVHCEPVLQTTLKNAVGVAAADPGFKAYEAETQNLLALVYFKTQRPKDAEIMDEEALESARQLVKADPSYKPLVAKTLNDLAQFYHLTQDKKETEDADLEALEDFRQLAEVNSAYQPSVAITLSNLADLYRTTQRNELAEKAYGEALSITRNLAAANSAYNPDLALVLANEGYFYYDTGRRKEAEDAEKEALELCRQLANSNPDAFQPFLAQTLNNLGSLYVSMQAFDKAESVYGEALGIRQQLAKNDPAAYQVDVAETLNEMAYVYFNSRRMNEAENCLESALKIRRELAARNPNPYELSVGETLMYLAIFHFNVGNLPQASNEITESVAIFRKIRQSTPDFDTGVLAGSLIAAVRIEQDTDTKCSLAKEAAGLDSTPDVREAALKEVEKACVSRAP